MGDHASNESSLKSQGNEAFKQKKYGEAATLYTLAIQNTKSEDNLRVLLCNRAQCYIKLSEFDKSIVDCLSCLELNPLYVKAIYRLAVSYDATKEYAKAHKELDKLLHYDKANMDGIVLMRKVKALLKEQQAGMSQISSIIDAISKAKVDTESTAINGIKILTNLCYEDKYNAMEFGKKKGLQWLSQIIHNYVFSTVTAEYRRSTDAEKADLLLAAVRLISAASTHAEFVRAFVHIDTNIDSSTVILDSTQVMREWIISEEEDRISLCSLSQMLKYPHASTEFLQASLVMVMTVLRSLPLLSRTMTEADRKNDKSDDIPLSLRRASFVEVLSGLMYVMSRDQNEELYSFASESISALLSTLDRYFNAEKVVDIRLESMDDRKLRLHREAALLFRSQAHTNWALSQDLLSLLVQHLEHESGAIRLHASACLGKIAQGIIASDNTDRTAEIDPTSSIEDFKRRLQKFLPGRLSPMEEQQQQERSESKRVVELSDEAEGELALSIPGYRLRAALTAALMVPCPELGAWALRKPGGMDQLLRLVATDDVRCVGIAAEVLCLTASNEEVSCLLRPLVDTGVLKTLMQSSNPSIRAAGASAVTKLSIKAKALKEDSAEISSILNTTLDVLKIAIAALQTPSSSSSLGGPSHGQTKDKNMTTASPVSFSSMDDGGKKAGKDGKNKSEPVLTKNRPN